MNIQWENTKPTGLKHSSRWGHSSAVLPSNQLILYGGYAGKTSLSQTVDSKFLKDVWVFNPTKSTWVQVVFDETSMKPVQRSNCSFFYMDAYQGVIMFGGGSSQNAKLNDLWCLNISENTQNNLYEGKWKELYPQNGKVPWSRTYHASEIFCEFLLIHGGQSYAGEIQDFWALNLRDLQWVQLKSSIKQQARKFHSSAIIRQKFYVFGGIHQNYQTINKIQFVDLSALKSLTIQEIEDYRFEWKEVQLNGSFSNTIARWGHVSKVYQENVYIFGGRTFTDQNDLLVFNPKVNSLQKVRIQKAPQGRRKPCVWLVGSIFIINSGYNGNYILDQHWVNLRFIENQIQENRLVLPGKIQNKQLCDIHINTQDNKYIDLYSKFIRNSFQKEDHMIGMLQELAQMKYETASQYVQILNNGIYVSRNQAGQHEEEEVFSKQSIADSEKFDDVDEKLLKKYRITYSNSELLANKKKILFNVVKENIVMNLNPLKLIRVSEQEFSRIFTEIQSDCCCDLTILFSANKSSKDPKPQKKAIKCCKYPLIIRSDYWRNIIQNLESRTKNKRHQQLTLEISGDQAQFELMKVIVLYCYYGHVIIEKKFNLIQCMALYKMAKKYSLQPLMSICFSEIKQLIFSKETQDWIWSQLTRKSDKKVEGKFNPENTSSNRIPQTSQQEGVMSCQQFEDFVNFCLGESKTSLMKSKSLSNPIQNKWMQVIHYVISCFAQLLIKRYVNERVEKDMIKSRLCKKITKHTNEFKKSNKSSNKQNIPSQSKHDLDLSESLISFKYEKPQKIQNTPKEQKRTFFHLIENLIETNIINPMASLFKSTTTNQSSLMAFFQQQPSKKSIFSSSVVAFFGNAVKKQRYLSDFKFKVLLSDLKA